MNTEKIESARQKMNAYGKAGKKFIFIIDFEIDNPEVLLPEEASECGVFYDIEGTTNTENMKNPQTQTISLKKFPVSFDEYCKSFALVMENIVNGNSYLLNLTFPTPVETDCTLGTIYNISRARYKLLYRDDFVLFSPEPFVRISGSTISSYPMKGTARMQCSDSIMKLMEDEKELSEHITIVDLIRNDLGMVSEDVRVKRFRYPEIVETSGGPIIQTSSEITGNPGSGWKTRIGDIIFRLVPAGSVTGAPKKKTVEIIREAETCERGYYTGVFGYFDGKSLNSAVMIRFIEKRENKLFFRSGGGITVYSDPAKEYREMIDKVYAAVD